MEDKRKIYLLLIILVLFLGFMYIALKKNVKEELKTEQTPQAIQETPKKETQKDQKTENPFPSSIEGIVVKMNNIKWDLEKEGKIYQIGFNMETPVYKESKQTKATIFDVKAGIKIQAILNPQTGDVIEAIIVK